MFVHRVYPFMLALRCALRVDQAPIDADFLELSTEIFDIDAPVLNDQRNVPGVSGSALLERFVGDAAASTTKSTKPIPVVPNVFAPAPQGFPARPKRGAPSRRLPLTVDEEGIDEDSTDDPSGESSGVQLPQSARTGSEGSARPQPPTLPSLQIQKGVDPRIVPSTVEDSSTMDENSTLSAAAAATAVLAVAAGGQPQLQQSSSLEVFDDDLQRLPVRREVFVADSSSLEVVFADRSTSSQTFPAVGSIEQLTSRPQIEAQLRQWKTQRTSATATALRRGGGDQHVLAKQEALFRQNVLVAVLALPDSPRRPRLVRRWKKALSGWKKALSGGSSTSLRTMGSDWGHDSF